MGSPGDNRIGSGSPLCTTMSSREGGGPGAVEPSKDDVSDGEMETASDTTGVDVKEDEAPTADKVQSVVSAVILGEEQEKNQGKSGLSIPPEKLKGMTMEKMEKEMDRMAATLAAKVGAKAGPAKKKQG
mmetsp:Transcript_13249/g.33799  ORF Transcript_13249/g.33799 Transcript_13249/m.33799 type:complete len:129 (+) Transcript_13249:147-533(+)